LVGGKLEASSLVPGQLVSGIIKSIKGYSAFLQLFNMAEQVIGRLHRLEAQSGFEFDGFSTGESIKAKVLKISKGNVL
jgi:ribosomal protein S1